MTQYSPPPAGGYPPPGGYPPGGAPGAYGQAPPSPALAIVSMVLGILSIVTFCIPYLAIPLGIGAIVCAVIARGKIRQGRATGGGMATAGMITGALGLIIGIVVIILSVVYGAQLMKWAEDQQQKAQQQQQQQQQSGNP